MIDQQGWYNAANHQLCPHFDSRPLGEQISLLVIHNISLPAGQFATPYVKQLFLGTLDCQAHSSFSDLQGLRVSAHCFIERSGKITQFVPFEQRAWHAGISAFAGRSQCNDFSIGIELEGTDTSGYTTAQYQQLAKLTQAICQRYPLIDQQRIVGHCDIAPSRKTDPGESFDWTHYYQLVFSLNSG